METLKKSEYNNVMNELTQIRTRLVAIAKEINDTEFAEEATSLCAAMEARLSDANRILADAQQSLRYYAQEVNPETWRI